MISINPAVVRVSDGRVGTLVARLGLNGCVAFGDSRILETHSLTTLDYHLTLYVPIRRKMRKV